MMLEGNVFFYSILHACALDTG